jgi:hypothetical protein
LGAIPGPDGVYHTCYSDRSGTLRVIDPSVSQCGGREMPAELLGATGKAADSDKLDGKDAADFLGATAQAADSDKLDGLDSTEFVRTAGESFAKTGPITEGTLSDEPIEAASVTVAAPAPGTMLVTAEATFRAHQADSSVWADISVDGRLPYPVPETSWEPGDLDSFYDQHQTLTWAVPVTNAGSYTYALRLAEYPATTHSDYFAHVTATYLPGTP